MLAGSPGPDGAELGGPDRVEQAHRIVAAYHTIDEHPRADTAPAGMGFLGYASDVAVLEDAGDGPARGRVARHLDKNLFSEEQVAARHDRGPIEPLQRHVLADAAGADRVALDLQALDRLDRIETDGAVEPAVVSVAVRVAFDPVDRDTRRRNRRLRYSAARDADLDDPGVHC